MAVSTYSELFAVIGLLINFKRGIIKTVLIGRWALGSTKDRIPTASDGQIRRHYAHFTIPMKEELCLQLHLTDYENTLTQKHYQTNYAMKIARSSGMLK